MQEKDPIEELLEEDEAAHTEAAEQTGTDGIQSGEEITEPSPEEEIAKLKEKILKISADHENHIKRLIRENDERIKYANQTLLTRFLPVLDNFDLALAHIESAGTEDSAAKNSTIGGLAEGVALTRKQLLDTLEKAGLQQIPVKAGDPFDPLIHEGIMLANNPELPDNSVVLLVQNGYRLSERILRSAKVQVNKLN
ncbi:MAG: nucleotide exchange factor GrpE [Deferribacteraceae bacterium]|jgi:molecular chaperone GrpE|nr:nucleotide exchange factor GrpE [Deferribacteraceae bacterium]